MANSAKRQRRRWDAYAFLGVRPQPTVRGVFGDPKARVITLLRRSKKRSAAAAAGCSRVGTIAGSGECAICPAATCGCCSSSRFGASIVGVAAKVKRERLEFLSDNPFYTKRFTYYVGRRCRTATIKHVAEELHLDWDSVKTLEMQYMRAQLAKAGTPGPKAIGIDEISIRKGHTYRIVVSDLIRRRPIWFGGPLGSEHGDVLRGAWQEAARPHSHGGDGYVETVSQRDHGGGAASSDLVRQVPYHASSRGSLSTRYARPSTRGSAARIAASSKVSSTTCCRGART